MTILFTTFVVLVVLYSLARIIKKKRMPNNHYTPSNRIDEGKREE
ncbi:hypothetical protein SFC65_27465 [Priestia filamentosa]